VGCRRPGWRWCRRCAYAERTSPIGGRLGRSRARSTGSRRWGCGCLAPCPWAYCRTVEVRAADTGVADRDALDLLSGLDVTVGDGGVRVLGRVRQRLVALNPPAGLVGDDDETCATPASSLHASAFAIAWAMRSVNSTMHCSVRGKPPTPRRGRAPNTTTDRDRNVNRGADSSRPDGLGQALPRHVVHVEAGSAASCRTGPAAWLAWAVCVGTCSYGPEGPRCSNAPGLSGW